MLSLQEGKNRIALKAISLVIVQVFLATSLVYPSSIKDMAAIYKLNSKLRVPLANSEEEKSWFSSRFLDKTNEQSSDRKSNASFPLRGEYSRRRSPKYILASLIDMLVGNPANTLSDSELNKNLEDFKASFLEKIPVSDRPAYLKEMVNYLSAQAIRFRSSFPEVEKLRQRFERYINNSRKIMADAGDTVLKKDIKTQEVINRFEEKGGDYYKKAIDHFKDSKTDKGTQFIDLGTPARLTRVYEVIEHYGGELKTKNILDIGCSYGLFLHILKGLGIEASGLDQDEDFVEYGKNDGLDIRKSDITEKDIPVDERFDITTSVYVLDHISLNDQDAFLRTFNNIFDLTKDEGLSIHYLSEDKYTFFEKNLDKLESYLLDRIFVDGGVILVFRKPAQGDMTLASAEDRQVDHTFSGSGDSEATRIGSLSAGEMAQEIWREAETRGEALPETRLSHLKESFERFFGTMPAIRLLSQEIMSGFGARSEPVIRYGNNIVISKEYYDENGFANAVTDEEALAAAGEGRAIMDPLLNILAHEQVASVAEEKGVLSDELPMLAEGVLNEADHETRRQAHLGGGVDQAFRGRKKKDTRIPADFADKTWLRKMIEEERAKHGPKEAKKISRRDVLKFMAGIGAVAATGRIAYELGEAPKDIKEEHEYLMQSLHEDFYDTMSHFSAQVRYLETSRSTKKNLLSREDMARVENFLSPSRVDAIRFAAKEYDLEPELIVGFVYEEETYQNSENRIKKVVKEFLSRVGGELDMRNTAGIGNTSAIYMLEDRSFLDTVYENKEFFLKLLKDRGAISVFNQFIDAYKEIIEIRYEPSWKAYIQNDAGVFISLVDRVEPVGILYAAYIMRKDANEIHERNRNETKIPDTSVMAGHSRHWTLRDRKEDYKPIPDVYNERYKRAFNQSYYPPYCYQYFVAADYTGIIVSRRGQARARGKIKAYLMFLRSSIFKAYDEQERLREIEQKEKKPPAPIKRKIDTKETRKLASRQKDKGPSRKFWNLRRKAALGVVALSLAGAKLPGVIPGEIAPRSEVRIEQGIVEDDKSERQIQKDVRACLEIIFDLPEEYITGWEKDKSFEEQNSYSKFIYTVLQDLKQDIESGKVEIHPLDRFILGLAGLLEIHGNTIVIKVPSGIITSGKIEPYAVVSLVSTTIHEYGHGLQWKYKLTNAMLKVSQFAGDHQVRNDTEKFIKEIISKILEAGIRLDKSGQAPQYITDAIGGAEALKNAAINGETFAEYIWNVYADKRPQVNIWNIMEGFTVFEEHFDEIVGANNALARLFDDLGINKRVIHDMRLSFQKPERLKSGSIAHNVFDKDDTRAIQDYVHQVWQKTSTKYEGKELIGAVAPFIEDGVEKQAVYVYMRDQIDINRFYLPALEAFNAKDVILIHAKPSITPNAEDIVHLIVDSNKKLWIISDEGVAQLEKSETSQAVGVNSFISDIRDIRHDELNPREKSVQRFKRYVRNNNLPDQDFREIAQGLGISTDIKSIERGPVRDKIVLSSSATKKLQQGRDDRDRRMLEISDSIAEIAGQLTYIGDTEGAEELRILSHKLGFGEVAENIIERATQLLEDSRGVRLGNAYMRLARLYFDIAIKYNRLDKPEQASIWVNKLLNITLDEVNETVSRGIKRLQARGNKLLEKIEKKMESLEIKLTMKPQRLIHIIAGTEDHLFSGWMHKWSNILDIDVYPTLHNIIIQHRSDPETMRDISFGYLSDWIKADLIETKDPEKRAAKETEIRKWISEIVDSLPESKLKEDIAAHPLLKISPDPKIAREIMLEMCGILKEISPHRAKFEGSIKSVSGEEHPILSLGAGTREHDQRLTEYLNGDLTLDTKSLGISPIYANAPNFFETIYGKKINHTHLLGMLQSEGRKDYFYLVKVGDQLKVAVMGGGMRKEDDERIKIEKMLTKLPIWNNAMMGKIRERGAHTIRGEHSVIGRLREIILAFILDKPDIYPEMDKKLFARIKEIVREIDALYENNPGRLMKQADEICLGHDPSGNHTLKELLESGTQGGDDIFQLLIGKTGNIESSLIKILPAEGIENDFRETYIILKAMQVLSGIAAIAGTGTTAIFPDIGESGSEERKEFYKALAGYIHNHLPKSLLCKMHSMAIVEALKDLGIEAVIMEKKMGEGAHYWVKTRDGFTIDAFTLGYGFDLRKAIDYKDVIVIKDDSGDKTEQGILERFYKSGFYQAQLTEEVWSGYASVLRYLKSFRSLTHIIEDLKTSSSRHQL